MSTILIDVPRGGAILVVVAKELVARLEETCLSDFLAVYTELIGPEDIDR